jgi:hypothetical protein
MKRSNFANLPNSRGANSTFSSSTKGNTVNYSSIISSNIPLYESPEVNLINYSLLLWKFGRKKENFQNHPFL